MHQDEALKAILHPWGVSLKKVRRELIPDGSPERTLFRVVVEDDQGRLFLLEQIHPSTYPLKIKIIQTLGFLAGQGMKRICCYHAARDGQYIQKYDDGLWQLMPFYQGVALDREAYLYEGWRAPVMARFLADLRTASAGIPFFAREEKFSIKGYIRTLLAQVRRYRPDVASGVGPVVAFLEQDFMEAHDALPAGFCHGDYHPLNIIWGSDDMMAVIDWEFTGFKPEMYDAANMVGCLGIEHPSSLEGELVVGLMRGLKEADIFQAVSWQHFFGLLVALRFAWLSEWLRKKDGEMVAMELEYMSLLIESRDFLREKWFLPG